MAKNKKKKKDVEKKYGNGIAPIAVNLGNQIAKNILEVENNVSTQQPENQANTTYYKKYGKLYKQELINSNVNGKKDTYTYRNTEIKKQEEKDKILNDSNITIEDKSLSKEDAKNKWDKASEELNKYKKNKGINLFNQSNYSKDKKYQSLLKNAQSAQKEYTSAVDYQGGQELEQTLKETNPVASTIIKGEYALAEGFTRGVGGLESTARKISGQVNENEREKYDIFEPSLETAYKSANKPEQIAMNILQSWGQMIPQMAAPNSTIAMGLGFANYGGSAYNDAKKEGYNEKQATMFGIASGATEMLMEKLLGGFENVYGKSALGSSTKTFTNRVINKFIKNEAVRKTLSNMKSEFTEEYLQEFLEPILKNIILEEDNGADFWNTMKDDWKLGIKQLASQLFNQQNLEAGFQGSLSSGLIQGPQNFALQKEANKYGMTMDQYTNAVNGTVELTDNVKKVIDNVLNERIQDEYDGKATKKEKEQLKNEIIEDIKNGYISTDEIEKTLGGETYTKLDEVNQKRAKLQQEINDLQLKADNNQLGSLEEKQKLNDLKEEISKIDDSEIRNQLNQEIQETIKNDIGLQESYREIGRRTENYNVDLSKVENEKQKEVYQKAMDSGVLNNSNKTHALVDMIAKISSDKGINFDFTNNEQLEKSGFGVNGRNINGYVTDSGITINLNSGKAINRIVGHELTHTFEGTTLYTELQDSLKDFLGSEWDNQLNKYKELYKGVKNANIENELTSDLIGDYLFTDENYVKELSTKNKNVFEKIYDEIKYLYNVATAGSKEKRQLEKVKRTFDRIYNETESKVTTEDAKYSISKDSNGKNLTKEQQEYFKDSKVRDNEGRLLEVYHGTPNSDFNEFKKGGGEHGKGFYFAEDKSYAEEFSDNDDGRLIKSYLKIDNPLSKDVDKNSSSMKKFVNEVSSKWDISKKEILDIFNPYNEEWSSDLSSKVAEKMGYGIEDVENIVGFEVEDPEEFGITDYNAYLGSYAWDNGLNELARECGFDGIISRIYNSDADGYEYVAFYSNQIKNVDNTNPTSNEDIRYDLSVSEANTTEDNNGRKLSKQQKEYFKDSKAVDNDGNLITVYHTMTDTGVQFNEFNPVGTTGYRYGDQVVNFFTNSKTMSGSYADYKYKMADTKKLKNLDDLQNWLNKQNKKVKNTVIDEYGIKERENGAYSITENGKGILNFESEEDLLKNAKRSLYSYKKAFGDNKGYEKYQYEGYLNITNPYIVEGNEANWDNIITGYDETSIRYANEISQEDKQALRDLYEESKYNYEHRFDRLDELHKQIDKIQEEHAGTKLYKLKNWIDNAKNDKEIREILNFWGLTRKEYKQWVELDNLLEEERNKIGSIFDNPRFEDTYFRENVEELKNKINNEQHMGYDDYELFEMAKADFDEEKIKGIFAKKETTNDIVKKVIKMNKNGANYDGVIIKKILDYGSTMEFDDMGAAQDVYVTFNSNQFKAVDNKKPTTDPDIRYSLSQDSQGRELSKQQQEYFKDEAPEVLDENGNLQVMYHSTPNKFTVFDKKMLGENTYYGNTAFGFFVTPDKNFSQRFKDINEEGIKGNTMELYAHITKPITHPYNAHYKYSRAELDSVVENYLKATGNKEFLQELKEYAAEEEMSLYNMYMNLAMSEDIFEFASEDKKALMKKGYDAVEFVEGLDRDVNYNVSDSDKPISSYAVFRANQLKNVDNLNPTANDDIRYSLSTDSNGRELSKEQQEYFRDSKVRDDNGNLKPLYHGSNVIDTTIFNKDKFGNVGITFLTDSSDIADTYRNNKGKRYEFYANIENPLVINGEGKNWNDILVGDNATAENLYNSLTNEEKTYLTDLAKQMNDMYLGENLGREQSIEGFYQRINAYDENLYDRLAEDTSIRRKIYDAAKNNWTETYVKNLLGKRKNTNQLVAEAYDSGKYDGVIFKNIVDRGAYYHKPIGRQLSDVYVTFNSNQIKNVDNLNPTTNPDIRYDLTKDSEGRKLSKGQQEYFKDETPELLDENGNLKQVYHGTNYDFTVFKNPERQFNEYASGEMFANTSVSMFTDSQEVAQTYIDNQEFPDRKPMGVYLKMTHPYVVDAKFQKNRYFFDNDGTPTNVNTLVKKIYDSGEYDGVVIKNIADVGAYEDYDLNWGREYATDYIVFESNQVKDVNNLNPTENEDIRYDLSIAPISKNFLTEAEQDELDGLRAVENSGFSELTPEEQSRMYELENKANTILNKKAEKMLRSASYKAINTTTKIAQNYLDFDAKQKKEFRSQMREFSNMTKDELVNADTYNKVKDIVSQYANKEYTYFDDSVESLKRELKHTKIQISDELKNQITDYGDFVKDSKLMLRRNSGQSVDKVYQEYSNMYPGFFDENVWNEADQLEALNDFVNHDFSVTEKYRLTDEDLRNATDLIYNKLLDNSLTQQDLIETEEILDKKVQKRTRSIVREELLNKMGITPELIQEGNDISAISFARTDPIRVNEKVFGWKTGQLINDATVNFTKHQEAERIRFLNKERQEIKELGIKARSKESELVQKYGEKQYVDKNNEVHEYGDAELARDVQDAATREKIKNAAKVLRQKYDTYIDQVNAVLTEMGYDEIPKRKDYMRHFVELDDKFSRWGLPFNKESMSAEDLPTDINGLTEFNKPGRSYFANAKARTGLQTTYDAITGIDGYLEGMSNWIYHTESIQRYRALSRLIRENYGREHGLDNIDLMTDEELADRIKDIQDNKLSKYVAWLDEQANSIAGKKAAIDRSLEKTFGRKVYTALNTLKSQIGSNMTGFNVRSAMTNFASLIQGMSKTQKIGSAEGLVSTVRNIVHDDGLMEKSDFLTSRLLQSESLAVKPWQKLSKAGQVFMEGTDWFTANAIWRGKYYENLHKGMSEQQAIKNADDFAARIMGDRSKGATAELFNSKTWGFLTQFQLEVNNQWSSLIHDNKIDIQKGNKTALGVTFELGQLFAASYMFNTMMKSLTGSDVMIDPIDMLKKIFNPDDDDKDKSIVERAQEVLGEFINQLPFASMFTGGRIPIGEAFKGGTTLVKKLSGGTDNYGNKIDWADVDEDLKDSLAYWILPSGWGQIKKTTKGLSMYDDKLPIAGSYTKSGNLRFSAEDTTLGKVKAGLFGQYSSKYAQDYIKSGYKSINASKLDEMQDLDMNSTEYREYRQGLSEAGTSVQEKLNYISSLDVSDDDKSIMASNVAKKDIDMSEYKKYGSYEEFNYAQKNPAKYQMMKYVGGYNAYKNYEKAISEIKSDYDRNGKAITNSRKNKVIQYVNSLNLTKTQKAMLIKEQYPSFTKYDSDIASYINGQNIRYIEKASILKHLGFTAYDKQIINYIRQNYRTVEEQQKELEKLGFKVYNYNGNTYVR